MADTSNIDDVMRFLEQFVEDFNFNRKGEDQSLGRDVLKRGVERIHDRSTDERKGFGQEWPKNSDTPSKWYPEGYRLWKDKHYNVEEPNSRTGQMLSKESLAGRSKIESRLITMIYGTNEPPVAAIFGDPPERYFERDQKVTDTFKAYLAHTGQSKKKIIRAFYNLEEDDGQAISELCQANLNEMIRNSNAERGV
jgi:hypothetical protein